MRPDLPPGVTVIERGWLSSNSILLGGDERGAVLIDSGYCTHAEQTLALLDHALAGERLRLLINTHLHSDHCGGNARIAVRHGCPIWVPPGHYEAARQWDETALTYRVTGQHCERFTPDAALLPGQTLEQADLVWQVLAAPGHDPHSLMLFEPEHGVLISADALWEHGFGIVFPEIDGIQAFDEVEATLDLIARLPVRTVVPGHGPAFSDVAAALAEARARLAYLRGQPRRHARHAAKALVMFHLLETGLQNTSTLIDWLSGTPIHRQIWAGNFSDVDIRAWSETLLTELASSGTVILSDGLISPRKIG